jgi:putative ABC transport system ATP-binding protein
MVSETAQAPPHLAASDPAVVVADVSKTYVRGRVAVQALANTSLSVAEGEFLAVMGPSGSGKSTLLHLIAGLDAPTSGSISIRGRCISAMTDDEATAFRRKHIGIIYQHFNLFPDLTVEQNVSVPLMLEGLASDAVAPRVTRALEDVQLVDRRHHLPSEISGGELQRVAIARALVAEPAIVLADEPTGNLDSVTGERVLLDMRHAVDEQRRTIILVTHDARAAAFADRIARLRDGAFEVS